MTTREVTKSDSIPDKNNVGNPVSKALPPASAPVAVPPPSGNGYATRYSSCPFSDAELGGPVDQKAPLDSPRTTGFRTKMRSILSGDRGNKIAMTAEAGVKCLVNYGSCGSHASTWWAIAGVGPNTLGANNPEVGGTTAWGGTNHEPPTKIALQTLGVACGTECAGSQFAKENCPEGRCTSRTAKGSDGKPTTYYKVVNDCFGKSGATDEVRKLMEGPGGPPGWPDSWTSKLEVGDYIWVYNGNASCGATHAEIFLGWTGGGKGMVAAGQATGPQWEYAPCLMRACGKFDIVTRIFKPR
jgi:hypothetical protein